MTAPKKKPSNNGVKMTVTRKTEDWTPEDLRRWTLEQAVAAVGRMSSTEDAAMATEIADHFLTWLKKGETRRKK